MSKKKFCPLMSFEGDNTYYCSEDKCAWWNYQVESCAVAVIAIKTGFDVMRE